MKRNITILFSIFIFGVIALVAGWPYIQMGFASSAHYTELDNREYEYYTPDLLKEMPRISKNYAFSYTNISGPQAFVYGVQFKGTTDTSKIREYLKNKGYEHEKECQTAAECWRSPRSKDVVSFYSLSELNLVGVEIYRREHAD